MFAHEVDNYHMCSCCHGMTPKLYFIRIFDQIYSEDAINFIHTKFLVKDCEFKFASSDAIDRASSSEFVTIASLAM